VGSTTGILNYAKTSPAAEFIVATESGILHQMEMACPDKTFISAPGEGGCACSECPHMETQHDGETLSLYEGPEAGNHPRRTIAPARLAAHPPDAGDELEFDEFLPMSPSIDVSAYTMCCDRFLPKTSALATSPRKPSFPRRSARA